MGADVVMLLCCCVARTRTPHVNVPSFSGGCSFSSTSRCTFSLAALISLKRLRSIRLLSKGWVGCKRMITGGVESGT
ncbi:hypothetical protein DFJ73DRAFT_259214 [Zopfochytrium polystomum]|nr:hypothetical protein DFJ73DRAFT_259214 [Zopfochytrium polystomum]